MNPLNKMELAALAEFKNDLEGLTLPQLEYELDQVTDHINNETDWQEALTARLHQLELT